MTMRANFHRLERCFCLLGILLVATIVPRLASAREANFTAPMTTLEMRVCGDESFRSATERLDDVRRRLVGYLNDEQRKALAEADAKWLQYREANCKSISMLFSGGSLESVDYVNWRASMTLIRFKELSELYEYLSAILVPRKSDH